MNTNYGDPPNPQLPSHRSITYDGGLGPVIDCSTCERKFKSHEEHLDFVQLPLKYGTLWPEDN